jgi:hypothetical protein
MVRVQNEYRFLRERAFAPIQNLECLFHLIKEVIKIKWMQT